MIPPDKIEEMREEFSKYYAWFSASGIHGNEKIKAMADFWLEKVQAAYRSGIEDAGKLSIVNPKKNEVNKEDYNHPDIRCLRCDKQIEECTCPPLKFNPQA